MKAGLFFIFFTMLMAFFDKSINFDLTSSKTSFNPKKSASDLYKSIAEPSLSFDAFELAFTGYKILAEENRLHNDTLLTLIDYSCPSTQERLYIVDLKNQCIVLKTLVAHGKASGDLCPEKFSNSVQSHQSSLGFFITDHTYSGAHGYSLRINGVEKNINDNALQRAIVFHGANYVSTQFLDENGRLGRSFGCPALPMEENRQVIDLIKNKSCLFIYYPSEDYFLKSSFFTKKIISQVN